MGRKKGSERKKQAIGSNIGKKKCLPTYKAKKQQRLRKLKDLSSILRPKAYKKIENGKSNAMRIRLAANTKYHIDPAAGYSSIIKLYIDAENSDKAKDNLDEKLRKIELMKPLLPPKIIKDRMLKMALQNLKSKTSKVKDQKISKEYTAGNSTYIENELDLQLLKIAASIKGRTTAKYRMKNIEAESAKFSISDMQKRISGVRETSIENIDIFEGLNRSDFTQIKKFQHLKRI